MVRYVWAICIFLHCLKMGYSRSLNLTSLMNITDECDCGEAITPWIVGGRIAPENVYPWMVAILNNGRLHCGGSLINDRYILTAGHCLNWATKEDLKVVLGMHDRILMESEQRGGTEVDIDRIMVHHDFSSDFLHDTDDIGLIRLKKPVKFSKTFSTVCLPMTSRTYENEDGLVTGWGRTSQTGNPSRLLKQATVHIINNSECAKMPVVGEHIMDTMICAYQPEVDACQGDSGGPMVSDDRGHFEQIGVVSWGIGCAKKDVPGVYTKVHSYLEWIIANTQDAVYCKNT